MFACASLGWFGGGSGVVTPLPTIDIADIVPLRSLTASVAASWASDGSIQQNVHGVSTPAGDWFRPNAAGIGSSYWIRATLVSGDVPTSGTMGAWLALSAVRAWGLSVTNGIKTSQLLIEIAADAGGAAVVTSGTLTMAVESTD